jgi:citrate lyase alpha subunit
VPARSGLCGTALGSSLEVSSSPLPGSQSVAHGASGGTANWSVLPQIDLIYSHLAQRRLPSRKTTSDQVATVMNDGYSMGY